jgi:hydrogenase nickel incorporation protein HypB
LSQSRTLRIERDIMEKNNAYANSNRAYLAGLHTLALNLVSSPGSGKTSLLVRAINDLKSRFPIAVIEGDQQTANDAERIRTTGARAVQINTGKGCHLDAHMVAHALDDLALEPDGLMFIENVGNLICPAAFKLGVHLNVVVASVPEGADKPYKYPAMFRGADVLLLNKMDLCAYQEFDVEYFHHGVQVLNPGVAFFPISCRTGEGFDAWLDWLRARVSERSAASA